MSDVNFLIDDFTSARNFVSNLPDNIKNSRFAIDPHTGKIARWTPDHLVLACVGRRVVAMADALFSKDAGSLVGANGSIVALEGFGGYAVRALLVLKKCFPATQWESTLVNPTASTAQISRRFFDVTFDQTAWDLSQGFMQKHGMDQRLMPIPIVLSRTTLRDYGFRSLNSIDIFSKRQIVSATFGDLSTILIAPNGKELFPATILNFSMEIINFPLGQRQRMSQFLLMITAARLGLIPNADAINKLISPQIISNYQDLVQKSLHEMPKGNGVFRERRM